MKPSESEVAGVYAPVKNNNFIKFWLFIYCFSFFIPNVNLDIGFSLKLFMPMSLLTLLIFFDKLRLKLDAFDYIWLSFLVLGCISAAVSTDLLTGFRLSIGALLIVICYLILKSFLVYCAGFRIYFESVASRLAFAFAVASLFLYALGLYTIFPNFLSFEGDNVFGVIVDRGIPRLTGVVQDPNIFVFVATLLFFFVLTLKNKRLFDYFTLSLITLSIFLSLSRGGIAAIALLIFIMLAIKLMKFALSPTLNWQTLLQGGLLLAATTFMLTLLNRVEGVYQIVAARLESVADGSGRFEIWRNAISLWAESPIFGIGWHNFLYFNNSFFMRNNYAHNTFLEVLVETGIVGFILYFLFFLSIFFYLLTLVKHTNRFTYMMYSFIAMVIMLNALSLIISETLFFLLAILSVAAYRIQNPAVKAPVNSLS